MFVHESKQSRIECGCCVAEMATAVVPANKSVQKRNFLAKTHRLRHGTWLHTYRRHTQSRWATKACPRPALSCRKHVGQISHIKRPESKHRFDNLKGTERKGFRASHMLGNGAETDCVSELCHTACSIPAPLRNSPSYTSPVSLYNTRPIPSGSPFSSRAPLT